MSDVLSRRLDRLDRMREWDEAMAEVDRLLEWALGSGRLDLMKVAAFKLKLLAAAPTRDEFAAGKWTPEPASPEDIEAGREFGREVDAWYRDQQQPERRG